MELSTAIALIRDGVRMGDGNAQAWADLGAGSGLFSQALAALLPTGSSITAVDKDLAALQSISWKHKDKTLILLNSDISKNLELPPLDGVLIANALHYISDQPEFLSRLKSYLKKSGQIIVIEYDTDKGNPWVPYPVSNRRMQQLARSLDFDFRLLHTERSRYNTGDLYSALLEQRVV